MFAYCLIRGNGKIGINESAVLGVKIRKQFEIWPGARLGHRIIEMQCDEGITAWQQRSYFDLTKTTKTVGVTKTARPCAGGLRKYVDC